MIRLIVVFFSAYVINITVHELSHALASWLLHLRSTLYHFYVNVDYTSATLQQQAFVRSIGPLVSLLFGSAGFLAYRRARDQPRELPLLYLATFGTSIFLGNLVSVSFVGDFSRAAEALRVPMPVRYGVTAVAAVCVCVVHWYAGRALLGWASEEDGRFLAAGRVVVAPVVVGMTMVLLAYLPMPWNFALGWIASAVFWIVGAMGALVHANRPRSVSPHTSLRWSDALCAAAALVIVRWMTHGISFAP